MSMTLAAFCDMLSDIAPPEDVPSACRALWYAGRGNWDAAHALVQDGASLEDCEVHGYLHRREGDAANAAYWYRQAGRPVASGPLEAEWQAMAQRMLSRSSS